MDKVSYIGNADVNAIDELYNTYRKDPNSVDEGWRKFFEGFEFGQTNYEEGGEVPENFQKEFKVINLIEAYRTRGHLFTQTNPVRERRQYAPDLSIENFDLSEGDLDTVFQAGSRIGLGPATLKDIVAHMKSAYCESIGLEFHYIRNPKRKQWFMDELELDNRPKFTGDDKKKIFRKLSEATLFEQFLQKKYVGQKRFSVEGSESLISGLELMIRRGADLNVKEFVVGMAHRGRLNTLVNIFDKDLTELFGEIEGKEFDDADTFDGDVKYHLGLTRNVKVKDKEMQLTLAPNPSHLEAVGPVVEGITRAKVDDYLESENEVVPIIIHGDAAIAAQGVVYEVIQMSELDGYQTGGTIHIVVNNQVGFTTNYKDGRSSTYCTDIAKTTLSPVFHVNGDDVEAVAQTFLIALEYRQKFNKDIFIDLLSYRKYGHNEGDEPKFTQPKLYNKISKHPNPREIYKSQLIEEGVIDEAYDKKIKEELTGKLDSKYEASKKEDKVSVTNFLDDSSTDFESATEEDFQKVIDTKFPKEKLVELGKKLATLPEGKQVFRKVLKLFKDRLKMIENDKLDWGMAEMLAYATLLVEGHPVRVSGQDVERGTFSHRHAVVKTEDEEEEIITLNLLEKDQAEMSIYNSLLSEYGVLGYEYGYSIAQPNGLTIWEAQFGDFMNGAQIMIDQFISAGEDKWNVQSGLVMLLPHGYEGQGAEHSSGRMERYLQSCGDLNMQVINPTTPANNFHALRRQLKRNFRKPLIVFSPKMLLRYSKAVSTIDDLATGSFQEVIDDPRNIHDTATNVVLCSGKAYYDFLAEAEKREITDMAFVRVEQLYPLPQKQIDDILAKYKKTENIIWGQEEPENMGAWTFMAMNLRHIDLKCVSRRASAAPAAGAKEIHLRRLKELHDNLFQYAAVAAK
ncbi:2-oxoglutarate dehydrogenase E1 component [Brumimicrobium aurantiacum]|uniref:oxoglutarate dehydrogenase (succinyl-transferring) n=1 Tax=Brumimicrobium aurantiacum TaxID=1737063 RepID=A0A3E1EY68_9FLAO|nr:2-oxoglutarate dehydrogenase E1 component [Brumimicrobium aurantiacum]RFC54492.1 2-oxoglutarate dehydrogenase E1 component [Brumimicrobium aurantiacum]